MEPFRRHEGRMAPLDRANVDTDQIIPKQFLKRIERTGYGPFLFYDWRARLNPAGPRSCDWTSRRSARPAPGCRGSCPGTSNSPRCAIRTQQL